MSALVLTIGYVFGLVALGYAAGLVGLLKQEVGEALTEFVTTLALPVLLFRTMATADFGAAAPWSLWTTYFSVIVICWALGQFVTARVFGRDRNAAIVGGLVASFSNLALLGLPFVLAVFGHDGVSVLSLILAVHLPTMLAAAVVQFALAGSDGEPVHPLREAQNFVKALASNNLVVGIVLGLLWRVLGFDMPELAMRMVDTFAGLAGPLALFGMGLGLRRFGISANFMPALVLSFIKLIVMPALVIGSASLLGLPPLAAKVAVVGAAMPVGINPYLFAVRYGTGQALSSNALTIGTLIAVVTTGFWLTVAQALFG